VSIRDILERHRTSLGQFIRFGMVGLVGVVVNQSVLVAQNVIARDAFGVNRENPVWPIPFTDLSVRNYHVYAIVAFLVANFGNFLLNRYWTFRTGVRAAMWREYWPFLAVGLTAQGLGLLLMTALMHTGSPITLPSSVFDDSSGLRNKLYWANLIVIVCVTPVNFVLNKVWTFRRAGGKPRDDKPEAVR